MSKSTFVYVTYIRTSAERLWSALTTPEFTRQYWLGAHCESDWKPGSPWKLVFEDGRLADAGKIVEAHPPQRLVIKWRNEWSEELKAEGDSLCTFEIEAVPNASPQAVKLSVTHSIERPESKLIQAVSGGWPRILSNLKSLLETGETILAAKKASA
ncbi:MAG TPA: SRPBCC family protein [Steroidobacteraceae bacterium]|jgi:uncharacterized protein YndB with AHSA1/START domain